MPPLMQLPAYAYPQNGGIDFKPLGDAVDQYGQNALTRRKLDQGDAHMDLERQKVDIAGSQHAEDIRRNKMNEFGNLAHGISETTDPTARQQLIGIAQQRYPDLIAHAAAKGMDAENPEYWKAMRWNAQNYDPLGEKAKLAGIALQSAQLQQVKTQTPEWREANAERFGIMKGTPEHSQFIVNGQFTPKADTFTLKDGEVKYQQTRQPDGSYKVTQIAGEDGGGLKANDKVKAEAEMRKEVTRYATDYTTIRDAHGQIDAISKQPSAASDIAMVFSFMKILDPGSVVREGEYATAARAQGIPERFVSIFEKAKSGQFLSPEQRQDFLKQAAIIAASKRQFYEDKLDQYKRVAERTKINPNNVVLPERPVDNPQGGMVAAPAKAPKALRGRNPQTGDEIEWNGSEWAPVPRSPGAR